MSAGDWKDMLIAIQKGNMDIVKYHIKNGINPNYQHPEFCTTPLVESIEHERIEIAKYLLNKGADPSLKVGISNDSPLSIAKKTKNKELIALIRNSLPRKKYCFLKRLITRS